MLKHNSLLAFEDEKLVGFGDIDKNGYLDKLFVHKDYQGKGIATLLCSFLEKSVSTPSFTVHASITAKVFLRKWVIEL
ncbi:MAG TPA: GNAT family N-acetyltransferase [Tetragenococcus sp.]|nr:GNAT family N-acetyltransferase [Tetragenococcus sp.]